MIQQINILDTYNIGIVKFIHGTIEIDDKTYTWTATQNVSIHVISSNFPIDSDSIAKEAILELIEEEY